ncbi:hypothetical protein HMPREF0972_00876 [Actinomyces sp. oral taxon 848 str. F0332]|nr:hypothetical protein HMPREF0972_00876 [Actinomyces sp. oral taxon 848 str. F0332]
MPGVASLRRRRHTPADRAPTMPIRAAGGRSFPNGNGIGRSRPTVDLRRLSARQPTMRR